MLTIPTTRGLPAGSSGAVLTCSQLDSRVERMAAEQGGAPGAASAATRASSVYFALAAADAGVVARSAVVIMLVISSAHPGRTRAWSAPGPAGTGGVPGPVGIGRDSVAVRHDARVQQCGLGLPAGQPEAAATSASTMWLSVPPVTSRVPRRSRPSASARALATTGTRNRRRKAGGPRRTRRPWPPSRAAAGRRAPSDSPGRRAGGYSAVHRTNPPRGPRSDLWVVSVTTSACGTGSKSPVSTSRPPARRSGPCPP